MRTLLPVLVPSLLAAGATATADVDPEQIFFPVRAVDSLTWIDSYGDPRGGGRSHLGVDLMADQMTPVFAAEAGEIHGFKDRCEPVGCTYYLLLRGDDGRMYFYVHLNEDTPGRPAGCDRVGGVENAFAPRLHDAREADELEGLRVHRGEHLGWVGSSGNAGCGVDHLHFEVWRGTDWSGAARGRSIPTRSWRVPGGRPTCTGRTDRSAGHPQEGFRFDATTAARIYGKLAA